MNQLRSSSIAGEETEYFDRTPVDLFISNILSRLPLKSIAQCRCISKLWSSRIRLPNYNLLFPIKPPAPPRILFTIEYERELFVYSSPQLHNPGENTSLVATLHQRTRGTGFSVYRPPVGGLVCRQHYRKNPMNPSPVVVISNPITGECLALPRLRMDEIKNNSKLFLGNVGYSFSFGYDPIDKKFKILRITTLYEYDTQNSSQYQVLTLGARKKNLLWRNIQCCTNHYPYMSHDDMICISGVLYYPAGCYKGKRHCVAIACFDVRSESFSFINVDLEDMTAEKISSYSFSLIDYKGKLGACYCDTYKNLFELWVLENAEEHKWSKHIYQMQLPEMISGVRATGMIGSGEIQCRALCLVK
ncbi:F-box associated interaction domain [Arabidopsis suecica]|uniref:F-box associated interaction domain n=1 Tax=Arabidopsis suecica TaxID=45249 RepID=A0A8T2CJ89_ARASU|nr:F-box associated interaction domain [Arabidopsis suecica]